MASTIGSRRSSGPNSRASARPASPRSWKGIGAHLRTAVLPLRPRASELPVGLLAQLGLEAGPVALEPDPLRRICGDRRAFRIVTRPGLLDDFLGVEARRTQLGNAGV